MTAITICQDGGDALDNLVARAVVREMQEDIESRGYATLCPSAGKTWSGVYRRLAEEHSDALDWTQVRLVQMDEYVGMGPDHPSSFTSQIRRELVVPLEIRVFQIFDASGVFDDASVAHFEATLGEPIDLVLHGVGRNGHIGFNEPGSSPTSRARVVDLHPETLEDNFKTVEDRAFYNQGVTLGMKTLLAARRSFLLAKGESKTLALRRLIHGPVDDDWPVSRLSGATRMHVFADSSAWRAD